MNFSLYYLLDVICCHSGIWLHIFGWQFLDYNQVLRPLILLHLEIEINGQCFGWVWATYSYLIFIFLFFISSYLIFEFVSVLWYYSIQYAFVIEKNCNFIKYLYPNRKSPLIKLSVYHFLLKNIKFYYTNWERTGPPQSKNQKQITTKNLKLMPFHW